MSSAHRPTWNPAEGRADERHKSARVSARHMPSHTKLKFRQPQQGGQASNLVNRDQSVRRDLRKELELAERESRRKRRKEQGLAPEQEPEEEDKGEIKAIEAGNIVDDDESKRRKLIEEMKRLDQDDEDSESDSSSSSRKKGKSKDIGNGTANENSNSSSESDSDSDDEENEEDDTAALLRELEKIKRERAEEKARVERERAEVDQSNREDEIALGNPLLNLENAMRGSAGGKQRGSKGVASFGVKRRWDDDVIFKNQAMGNDKDKDGFVNDLTREFRSKQRHSVFLLPFLSSSQFRCFHLDRF